MVMPSSTGMPNVGRLRWAGSELFLSSEGYISQETTPHICPSQFTMRIMATRLETSQSPVGSSAAFAGIIAASSSAKTRVDQRTSIILIRLDLTPSKTRLQGEGDKTT